MGAQDKNSPQDDNQKLIIGLVIGAAAGAAAALVLAPSVNEETKRKITEKAAPLRKLIGGNLNNLLHAGISALTAYAGKSGSGANSPLQTVVQVLRQLDKPAEEEKLPKKVGKKKRKNDQKDPQ